MQIADTVEDLNPERIIYRAMRSHTIPEGMRIEIDLVTIPFFSSSKITWPILLTNSISTFIISVIYVRLLSTLFS